jgi:glycerophosphoryl diester phosphodiesterase
LTPSYAGADTTVLIPGFVAGNGHNGLMPPSAAQPQVVAHRGASFEKAEHTLGAYVKALDAGAQGLECDVRLTADGHLVCVHDRDLRRTAARKGLVSTSNLEDLEALDFASWKNPWADLDDEAPDRDARLDGVLTLRKLLEAVADYDRRVEVAIETKHPTRYGGLVERRVVDLLHDFGWVEPSNGEPSPARVMSFSHAALQRTERLAPGVRLVQLIERPSYWPLLGRAMGADWVVGPGIELLTKHPRLAERIVATGHDVHVWTVNTESELRRCQALGVQAIITDRPAYMLELLGK